VTAGWFATVASNTPYEGAFLSVRVDEVAMPDGTTAHREVIGHLGAVAVVPVMDDGTVVLLKQYRHAIGRYNVEIPAGKLDVEGEDFEAAAQRELVEEIGHRAGRLDHLTTFLNSAGWTDEVTHVYLGRELEGATPPPEFQPKAEEADMEVLRLPMSECLAMVDEGSLTDAKTVIGLLLAARRLGLR